MTHIKRQKK